MKTLLTSPSTRPVQAETELEFPSITIGSRGGEVKDRDQAAGAPMSRIQDRSCDRNLVG